MTTKVFVATNGARFEETWRDGLLEESKYYTPDGILYWHTYFDMLGQLHIIERDKEDGKETMHTILK